MPLPPLYPLALTLLRRSWLPAALLFGLALLLPAHARAQVVCPDPVARLVAAEGPVELERASLVRPVARDDVLCPGDVVRVGPRGRAALALADGGLLRLDQHTVCRISAGPPERSLLDLLFGALHFLSRRTQALDVRTPFVNAAIEGTEFALRVLPDRARLDVYEGAVRLENPLGELLVASGQGAEALAGEPPVLRVVVRPRDAVQWALYYPPVLTPPAVAPPELAPALAAAARGDLAAAFAHLDEVPAAARDAGYHTLRAGLLLAVGRADEARAEVERALALEPENAEALALRAVIGVALDERARALADARRAVAADPGSAAAALALSYALQARFELEAARAALREAVAREPGAALVRARLAELELAFGAVGRARSAAETAAALAPDLGRAQAVLGFAALAALDLGAAEAAFARAIELQPGEPLAHLGRGLVLIRRSELEAGRAAIEVAAGLDPGGALLRSYLGKAYFEETDDVAAAEALATAKALDPLDPTAFFYDAIRKQLENRPVEALGDLETAIALNDNRAVFRSRLLLDEDRAARTVSLARIYRDLGFDQLAVTEAATSLSTAPATSSAHRFLADAYAELPRHEIARVSEVLQAQLLQPLTGDPVPPRLAITDLNVVAGGGPEAVGFNEFTPLFEREGPRLLLSGLLGNQETRAGEAVLSGLQGRFAYSLGHFRSTTDGFRPNNDVENRLSNVFGQVQLTPGLSLQAEYRRRKTEQGDLELRFDPDVFFPNRREVTQNTGRIGVHFAPSPRSDAIASFIYTDRDGAVDVAFDSGREIAERSEIEAYQAEFQYMLQTDLVNVIAGLGGYKADVEQREREIAPDGVITVDEADFEQTQRNIYLYNYIKVPSNVTWIVGLSYDDFEQDELDITKIGPKLGVVWDITDGLRLRAAAFRTVKRALAVDQTIEPTQVAGFNQFFDEVNGTVVNRYGIGLDARLTADLYGGIEISRRDLDVPIVLDDGIRTEDHREKLYRAYIYWTPRSDLAVSAEVRYDEFTRDPEVITAFPIEADTWSVPVAVRYFHPTGLFAELGATYVRQDVDKQTIELAPGIVFETGPMGSDDFVLVDAAVGYRLPDRRGIVRLGVNNLFDKEFFFQDDNFRTSEPRFPRFVPDRTFFARITLNF